MVRQKSCMYACFFAGSELAAVALMTLRDLQVLFLGATCPTDLKRIPELVENAADLAARQAGARADAFQAVGTTARARHATRVSDL
mmetsp:Transcript_9656/g.20028  ORF Transcript_9656/g.20028 Transcript_9656/m.20028 type:complete len:86 (+) Transcript_9656:600-857(+)